MPSRGLSFILLLLAFAAAGLGLTTTAEAARTCSGTLSHTTLASLLGSGPSHGSLTLSGDGSFTYTPTTGFSGTDSFTYTAHDAFQGSNTATVTILVGAPPVAVDDSYDVNQAGTLTVAAPGVLGNDTDPNGLTMTAVLGTNVAHGSLTLNADGSFTYVPTAGFQGTDSFTYTAHDSLQGSNVATVTIAVHAPPVAVNDSYNASENKVLSVPVATGVLANDADPGGLALTAVVGAGPGHGSLTLNGDGSFTYSPTAGFVGVDSFTYTAHDSFQGSNVATVTITVHAPPVAVDDAYTVAQNGTLTVAAGAGVLVNDSDPGGLALTAVLGTTYGGDGRVNFALPDLRAKVPMHTGNGHTLGERGGEQNHTLVTQELPSHTHLVTASAANGSVPGPGVPAAVNNVYGTASNLVSLDPASISTVGGSQPHNNMMPFLGLSFCIALQGIFPSRN